VYARVRRILIGFSLSVCMGQADTDWIFIERMHGVRQILIGYSLSVCMGQRIPIFIGCMHGSGGY